MIKEKVLLGRRSYEIIIGSGLLEKAGSYLKKLDIGTDAFVITNKFLKDKYGAKLSRSLINQGFSCHFMTVPDSEKSKSIKTASQVIKDLAARDQKKKFFIIALGGGVIGDLGGFIASVYKRGINYVQIPTTLLAQVDSSIGGKTAIDLDLGKNLVGAFYQPRLVLSDTVLLKSLDKRQLRSGLAEVIKYAVIKDKSFFEFLEKRKKEITSLESKSLEKIVGICSRIKAQITSKDEKEALGLRTILNFGHTIGHAIEAASGFNKYNHGEAVSLGMIAAVDLSKRLGLIGQACGQRIKKLIALYGLPVKLKGVSFEKIISAHYHDKKFSGKENKFVLITGIGKARTVKNIGLNLIKESLKSLYN